MESVIINKIRVSYSMILCEGRRGVGCDFQAKEEEEERGEDQLCEEVVNWII